MLNFLFGAKLPFGCKMIVRTKFFEEDRIYQVIYENNDVDSLTLIHESGSEEQHIIKKGIRQNIIYDTNYITDYNVLRIA